MRGVEPDRVRANAESAPDPVPEAADGLRAERRDGVPDGPYDPETDRLFVPTTDQLAAARDAEAAVDAPDAPEPSGSPDSPTLAEPSDPPPAAEEDADDPSQGEAAAPGAEDGADAGGDPDRLGDIDPEDILAGTVDVADLPEYAVQGGGDDADADAEDDAADEREGRFVDGAAAFEHDDGHGDDR